MTVIVDRLRDLSFALATGGAEETDPAKLLDRIAWGVDHIQQVEAKRAADLIEELSKTPRTTWGEVKKAILERAFPAPVRDHADRFDVEIGLLTESCSRSGAMSAASVGRNPEGHDRETGHGRNDEHAVPEGQTPSTKSGAPDNG